MKEANTESMVCEPGLRADNQPDSRDENQPGGRYDDQLFRRVDNQTVILGNTFFSKDGGRFGFKSAPLENIGSLT